MRFRLKFSTFIIYLFALMLLLACNKQKYDTVEDNHEQIYDGASPNIDYDKVFGTFKGDFQGAEAILVLNDDSSYSLQYKNRTFKGKYFNIYDNSMIDLEYMEYQSSLPFHMLSIEDPSLLTIHNPMDAENQYYLEKIESK